MYKHSKNVLSFVLNLVRFDTNITNNYEENILKFIFSTDIAFVPNKIICKINLKNELFFCFNMDT